MNFFWIIKDRVINQFWANLYPLYIEVAIYVFAMISSGGVFPSNTSHAIHDDSVQLPSRVLVCDNILFKVPYDSVVGDASDISFSLYSFQLAFILSYHTTSREIFMIMDGYI